MSEFGVRLHVRPNRRIKMQSKFFRYLNTDLHTLVSIILPVPPLTLNHINKEQA